MKLPPQSEESFQSSEVRRLALFTLNEYGIGFSSKLALWYVSQVLALLQNWPEFQKPQVRNTRKELVVRATRLQESCEYLAKFHEKREKFREVETIGTIEWVTKQVFRLLYRGHLKFLHQSIAHEIRSLHSDVSTILNGESELSFSSEVRL